MKGGRTGPRVIADLHCHYPMHLLDHVEKPHLRDAAVHGISPKDRLLAKLEQAWE